jgi:hypothetical protein
MRTPCRLGVRLRRVDDDAAALHKHGQPQRRTPWLYEEADEEVRG